jgi:hypothetical protein
MKPSSWFGAGGDRSLEPLWEDGERVFCRGWRHGTDGNRNAVLADFPQRSIRHPPASIASLTNTD